MKKLGKKKTVSTETVEAFASCLCMSVPCNQCYCTGRQQAMTQAVPQYSKTLASING